MKENHKKSNDSQRQEEILELNDLFGRIADAWANQNECVIKLSEDPLDVYASSLQRKLTSDISTFTERLVKGYQILNSEVNES